MLLSLPTVGRALFLTTGSRTNLFILAPIMKGLSILSVFGVKVTKMTGIVEEYLGAGTRGL